MVKENRAKLLWLCKKRYMRQDVIDDRYGRLFHLPMELSANFDVSAICIDYRSHGRPLEVCIDGVRFVSVFLGQFAFGALALVFFFRKLLLREKYHVVVSSSDCLQVLLGCYLAKRFDAKFIVDLYDNYESFGLAKLPFVRRYYRKALKQADLVVAVSGTLKKFVVGNFNKKCIVVESTIQEGMFARVAPGALSEKIREIGDVVVGVGGGLDAGHDINTLFAAMKSITADHKNIHFVFAGKASAELLACCDSNIHAIGPLKHAQMPEFFCALDLTVVGLADNDFGRFAFPQKAYEILACETPVVVADVGALAELFVDYPNLRYRPGDSESLAECILMQLVQREVVGLNVPTWQQKGLVLADHIAACLVE